MMTHQLEFYGIPLLFAGFFLRRFLRFRRVKAEIPALIQRGGVIIDVRTRGEFASGASNGSINIPLDEFAGSIDRFSIDQPIVLCCASGTRSGMALAILKRRGFKNALNAGPWRNTVT